MRLAFNFVQTTDPVQCLFGQLALVGHMQVEELAPRMGHAADFGDALLEAGLVAGEVVTDQLAVPGAEEVACMLACAARAEVVDHCLERRKRGGAVGPDVRPVGLLLARSQHLHRCFIRVDNRLGQHGFLQCIDQRLQLHAGLADPLRQRRAWDRQAGTTEDLLLPIQRQVVSELGHHHMSQQAGGGDAFVDDLGRHRRLDQCFALPTGPLAPHVLLDGEHAGRVVQLLADVLADALELAAAGALGVVRFVVDHGARQLWRQRSPLGLLARFGGGRFRPKGIEFGFDGFKVGGQQVVEQAALRRADLLAALGELVPLEDGDLVGELLDDGLVATALSPQGVDLRQQLRSEAAQLLRGQVVEIGRGSHGVDFTKSTPRLQLKAGIKAM